MNHKAGPRTFIVPKRALSPSNTTSAHHGLTTEEKDLTAGYVRAPAKVSKAIAAVYRSAEVLFLHQSYFDAGFVLCRINGNFTSLLSGLPNPAGSHCLFPHPSGF